MTKKVELPPDSELAKPGCNSCYGTGKSGFLVDGVDQKLPDGKIKKAPRISIICSCVKRAQTKKVPWLQRHGKDNQPWLVA